MRKINKKKIAIILLLLFIIIIELLALDFSSAEKSKEISLTITDSQKKISDFTFTINAYDSGESGYYIILPETINDIAVKNYLVEKKEINTNDEEEKIENNTNINVNNEVIQEENIIEENVINESENIIQNNITNENVNNTGENNVLNEEIEIENNKTTTIVTMQAGDRVYLTNQELENAQMTIEVEYEEESYALPEEEINMVDLTTDELPQLFANVSLLSVETDTSWEGTTATNFDIGDGTQQNPYLISTGDELAYLANQVNSGTTYEGVYFQIAADIDLNGKSWTPIGNEDHSFRGIIDGAGHTIANAVISITSANNNIETYGIFGTIGGGTQETILKNMAFNNIVVDFNVTRTISSNSYGYKIGIVTGAMYNNAKIQNTTVKNSQINHDGLITARYSSGWNTTYYAPILFVGGIAGDAVYSSSDASTTGTYSIDYCYSNVDISLNVTTSSSGGGGWGGNNTTPILCLGQINIGGIIGRIKSQNTYPTNSLYTGTITATSTNYANGLVGPIFGADRNSTGYNTTTNMNTIWNGDNRNSYTMNSYYNNYNVYGTTFTSTVTSGNAGTNTQYRRSTSNSNIGYVQGVNKGIYTNDISSRLNTFNQSNQNVSWEYTNSDLALIPRITATATETADNVCTIDINDPYNTGEYTYTWYVNGELDETLTGETGPTLESSFETEYDIKVVVYDGTYYAVETYYIPRLTIDIEFNINNSNNSVTAALTGTALQYASLEDYTYQWYMLDIAGDETKLEGENSLTLTNLQNAMEYKLVATNNRISKLSAEGSFIFGTRTVIYVDYSNGNNNNDGYTPETPVKTLSTAYSKLKSNGTRNENVIVIMGTNSEYNFYNSQTNTTYAKNATITGKYAGVDYNANWTFGSSSSYFRYLTADLTIMNMTLNGNNGSMYLICQGHSFTVGENVIMSNYATASTKQGLLGGNAPAFHVFAGWYQYNKTKLPNNDCEIIIKSGTYGRIILGGTPGTSSGQGQTTSHDFMGSSMEDSFRVSIRVDIKNSTTPEKYDYDVNLLVGGSASGNNYSIVTENIENGSIGRVLGGSIGDSASRPSRLVIPRKYLLRRNYHKS